MTHTGSDGTITERPPAGRDAPEDVGPDPVTGAGIALLGIFVMAVGGARDLHYVFDVGVAVAIIGAIVFVLFIALSAMKQRRRSLPPSPSP